MSWQALRCVLEHLSLRVDDQGQRVAAGNDQLVLIRLANHAHKDGAGIIVGRRRLAKGAGLSDRTVKDALGRLVKAGVLEREPGQGPKGVYRHRIPLCELCQAEDADRSSGYSGEDQRDRSSGYSSRGSDRIPTGVAATPKPYRTLPGPRELARLQAAAARPELNGSSDAGRGGGLAPSPAPPAVGLPADSSATPSGHAFAVVREDDPAEPDWRGTSAWSGDEMATLLPLQAGRTSRPAAAGGTA